MNDIDNCPSCGGRLTPNAKFCTTCGTPLVAPEPRACNRCGNTLSAKDKFCTECGTTVEEAGGTANSAAATVELSHAESPWGRILEQLRMVTSGRFGLERELGQGGMAAVYLARDIALGRAVAIKVMSPGILMEPGMVARFKQEAMTIAALKHPNIITVHSVEHHEGLHFFVLDFVEGGSLENVIHRYGPLPIPVVLAWFAQVGSALEYAHRRGVVHRDIKPANILLDNDGHAVLTDFGIAKVAKQTGLTMTGATVGTPTYMSPEQCLAFEVTGASDQYSLGVVLYQMLAGRPPFEGLMALAMMRAHTEQAPPPITEFRADCPPDLARVVHHMLEKDPAARWPKMADAVAASGASLPGIGSPITEELARLVRGESTISQVARSVTPSTPLPVAVSGAREGFTRHAKKVWIGGAAAVVAGGLVWLAPWDGLDGPPPPSTGAPIVSSVQVSPTPGQLIVGDTFVLSATPLDSAGAAVTGEAVTWRSSDETVVVVTDGRIIAAGPGTAVISAMAGEQIAMTNVTVTEPAPEADRSRPTPAVVAAVEVSPDPITISAGQSQFLSAVARAANRERITGRSVRWSVSDESVATVSQEGEVRAVGAGTARVTATIDGRSGVASVTVALEAVASVTVTPSSSELDRDATQQFRVLVQGTSGRALTGRAVQWQSSNPSVATVSSDGLVTGVGGGSATISATSGGLVSQASVTITAAAPAVDLATAEAQLGTWIERFVGNLDRALDEKTLAAVRNVYEVDMPADDAQEWTTRFAVDGDWSAGLAERFPVDMIGDAWVTSFNVLIHFSGGGRSTDFRQRFRAAFRLGTNGLVLDRLRMELGQ